MQTLLAATLAQKKIIRQRWNEAAQEPIKVTEFKGVMYAIGSEAACHRIEQAMKVGHAEFCIHLKQWTYCADRGWLQ